MTDEEFDTYLSECVWELNRKQSCLTEQFGLGTFARWDYDQTTERLTFSDEAGRPAVEATAIAIGSYSTNSGTWQWAWANESVPDGPRANSARLRALRDATGIDLFLMALLEVTDEMPWELAAMAVAHLEAEGCYRAPAGRHLFLFLAITEIYRVPTFDGVA